MGCGLPTVGPPATADLAAADDETARRIEELIQRATAEPDRADHRAALGLAYDAAGLGPEAVRSFEQARFLEPAEPRWSYYLAQSLAARGELPRALEALSQVLELEESYLPAHLYRGWWLVELGRFDEALAAFDRAAALDPGSKAASIGRARARLERDGADGGEPGRPEWPDPWLEAAAAAGSGRAALVREAEAMASRGEHEEAIARLLSALEANPDRVDLHLAISRVYRRRGDLERALEHVDRAIGIDPFLSGAHALRGRHLVAAGRRDEALAAFNAALELDARNATVVLAAAMLETQRADWNRAAERFEQATRLDPSLALAFIGLGGVRAEMGDLAASGRALDRAAELAPDSPQLAAARKRLDELQAAAR